MPRLAILNADEIKAFDKPPKFTKVQREKYFHINEKLSALLKTLRDSTYKKTPRWTHFSAFSLLNIYFFNLGISI